MNKRQIKELIKECIHEVLESNRKTISESSDAKMKSLADKLTASVKNFGKLLRSEGYYD